MPQIVRPILSPWQFCPGFLLFHFDNSSLFLTLPRSRFLFRNNNNRGVLLTFKCGKSAWVKGTEGVILEIGVWQAKKNKEELWINSTWMRVATWDQSSSLRCYSILFLATYSRATKELRKSLETPLLDKRRGSRGRPWWGCWQHKCVRKHFAEC